jgi:hypothetical protein
VSLVPPTLEGILMIMEAYIVTTDNKKLSEIEHHYLISNNAMVYPAGWNALEEG